MNDIANVNSLIVVCLTVLIILLAFAALKKDIFDFGEDRYKNIATGLLGALITIFNLELAITYAAIGLIVAAIALIRAARKRNGEEEGIIYVSLKNIEKGKLRIIKIGLSAMISVLAMFIIKVSWLANAI